MSGKQAGHFHKQASSNKTHCKLGNFTLHFLKIKNVSTNCSIYSLIKTGKEKQCESLWSNLFLLHVNAGHLFCKITLNIYYFEQMAYEKECKNTEGDDIVCICNWEAMGCGEDPERRLLHLSLEDNRPIAEHLQCILCSESLRPIRTGKRTTLFTRCPQNKS